MKIGVSGASGHLGRAVFSELPRRAGGHEVVAITRTPETVSGSAHARFGDYDRPESLAEAYAGLDRLLSLRSPEIAGRRTSPPSTRPRRPASNISSSCRPSARGGRRSRRAARPTGGASSI